jgi:hypothetical protein
MVTARRAARFASWPTKPAIAPVRLDPMGHAIGRYIERWRPALGWRAAETMLMRSLRDAVFVEDEPKNEQTFWRTAEGCLLVVDRMGTVRTVLPKNTSKRARRRHLKDLR